MAAPRNNFPDYLFVKKVSSFYWTATFTNGPLNLFGPETYTALRQLVADIESDKDVRVVVFDSSTPDYFIAHYDVSRALEEPEGPGTGAAATWGDFVIRFANLPVVTIAAIRGRVRGHGNEFIGACDIRFASREKAIFGQPEVGVGITPGGGAFDWLPRTVGRSRALEIILGADDFDASTAELYGWINRAIPDADFDAFVDRFARRIAGFDAQPLIASKRVINARAGLPTHEDLFSSMRLFLQGFTWPTRARRSKALAEKGMGRVGDAELNLGEIVGTITKEDLERHKL